MFQSSKIKLGALSYMKYYLLLALVTLATTDLYSMNAADAPAKLAQIAAIMLSDAPVAAKIAALSALKDALPAGAGLQNYFRNDILQKIELLNQAAHPIAAHPGAALGQALVFGGVPAVLAHPPALGDDDSDAMDTDSE